MGLSVSNTVDLEEITRTITSDITTNLKKELETTYRTQFDTKAYIEQGMNLIFQGKIQNSEISQTFMFNQIQNVLQTMQQAYDVGIKNQSKDVVKSDVKKALDNSAKAGFASVAMSNMLKKSTVNETLFTKEVNNIIDSVKNQFETITSTDVKSKQQLNAIFAKSSEMISSNIKQIAQFGNVQGTTQTGSVTDKTNVVNDAAKGSERKDDTDITGGAETSPMGGLIIFLLLGLLIYGVFKFARDYMLLIGAIVLIVGIVLTVMSAKSENGVSSAAIGCDIAGAVMIAFGIYIRWFMPGAQVLNVVDDGLDTVMQSQ